MTTIILPSNNEAGVRALKGRHRRQVLRAAGIGVDPEIATQNFRRRQHLAFTINRGEDLTTNIIARTCRWVVLVLIVRAATIITPSDDELTITKIGYRRLILRTAVRIGIN